MFGGELFFVLWVVVGFFLSMCVCPRIFEGIVTRPIALTVQPGPCASETKVDEVERQFLEGLFPKGRVRGAGVCPSGAAAAGSPQAARPCPRRAPFSDIPQAGAAI